MLDRTIDDIRDAAPLAIRIDRYDRDGSGVVELADGRLHVPGALPGERVRVSIAGDTVQNGDVEGRLLEVIERSDIRRDPLCERDDVCTGCRLRHVTVDEELQLQQQYVREAVGSHVDSPPEIERVTPWPITRGDAFRIRTELAYRRLDGEVEMGRTSPVRESLVPMEHCPALTTSAQRLVSYVETAMRGLASHPPEGSEVASSDGVGLDAVALASPTFGRGLIDVQIAGIEADSPSEAIEGTSLETLTAILEGELPEDVGVALSAEGAYEVIVPPERIDLPLASLQLEVGYGDWCPPTLEPIEALYDRTLEWLDLQSGDRFLDIGSGIGTIALLAAPHVEYATGVDNDPHAVETAELNALHNDVENIEFVAAGWEKVLRRLVLDERTFESAVLHPPGRSLGARPLAYLQRLGTERLVYIGPKPEAAAADIAELDTQGWQLDALAAANVDPASAHTVLLARLSR
jgi:23S rRNA (uracil1939-C5)-methyltransferase